MTVSIGQRLRTVGLKSNISFNGDFVTFRAQRIRALVETNSLPDPQTQPNGLQFGERGEVSVEMLRTDVSSIPEVGEYLIDADARRLRITLVSRTPISYVCECAAK